jgi:hypothetical protein
MDGGKLIKVHAYTKVVNGRQVHIKGYTKRVIKHRATLKAKPAKKSVRKPAKKLVRKSAKKSVRKPAKKHYLKGRGLDDGSMASGFTGGYGEGFTGGDGEGFTGGEGEGLTGGARKRRTKRKVIRKHRTLYTNPEIKASYNNYPNPSNVSEPVQFSPADFGYIFKDSRGVTYFVNRKGKPVEWTKHLRGLQLLRTKSGSSSKQLALRHKNLSQMDPMNAEEYDMYLPRGLGLE